jgi:hypothetical protein
MLPVAIQYPGALELIVKSTIAKSIKQHTDNVSETEWLFSHGNTYLHLQ